MEYSIRELSELAGVSTRTLRYYDEIGLLKPLYVNEAGYRFYGGHEAALLQQILFYRERGFGLQQIQRILYQEDFDMLHALQEHLLELEEQRTHIDALIRVVKQTIASEKGECEMTEKEKFEAFKKELVEDNRKAYGAELLERYGAEELEASDRKLLHMSKEEYESFRSMEQRIREWLMTGVKAGLKPESEEAGELVRLHKSWLMMTWRSYSPETHKGLAAAYVEDERFRQYYDGEMQGCALLLKQSIESWADRL